MKRRPAADMFREHIIMHKKGRAQAETDEPDISDFMLETEEFDGDMEDMLAGRACPPAAAATRSGKMKQPGKKGGMTMTGQDFRGRAKSSEELQLEKDPIQVRETGFWPFKRVIVPPNAYVVHTRLGRAEPMSIGLGRSFRYNPATDTYLVVPAAMQTIGVVADCITREKQGINVLAYVQWQIADFSIAYRKLDFGDRRDPLGIVNAQLSEQAEAAVKDKISTMSIEEVLTDKAPVIEELTTRLREVAEGRGKSEADDGLGIKIVTVQIREALVSSAKLWEDLQAPFRHQKEAAARESSLVTQDKLRQKELEIRRQAEISDAETATELEKIRLEQESIRLHQAQEHARQKLALEEETAIAERESRQRLKAHEEKTALETEKLRREMETEQALHAMAEEKRRAEAEAALKAEKFRQELELKTQEAEMKLALQEQDIRLENHLLEAHMEQERREKQLEMELAEKAALARFARIEKKMEFARIHQEIMNMTGSQDLKRRFIQKLPMVLERISGK